MTINVPRELLERVIMSTYMYWPDAPLIKEIRALLSDPVQQVSVPGGWKLVPIEPTEAMLDAGCKALVGSIGGYEAGQVYRCYDAMLALSAGKEKQDERS